MAASVSYEDCIRIKIEEAEELIQECGNLKIKDGQQKLQKKVESELKFLRNLSKHPDRIKKEHLRCSNLSHLSAIFACAKNQLEVTEILKPFLYITYNMFSEKEQKRIVVDVVADRGQCWIKVVARNPQAMAQSTFGSCEFGKRTIIKQLEDMIECAKQNPYMYYPVYIKVCFTSGITNNLKEMIEKLGIDVLADDIQDDPINTIKDDDDDDDQDNDYDISNCDLLKRTNIEIFKRQFCQDDNIYLNKENCGIQTIESFDYHSLLPNEAPLNLDISTIIAYVSALTNGHCNVRFIENILTEQAERERSFPVRPDLDNLFEDRKLICCETAYKDFNTIINTIGGENEKKRADDLLSRVTVVPDNPSDKSLSLKKSSKIKDRPLIIFGTGDNLKAITVSSNRGFVRAAEGQGIKFVVYLHESRALTEVKQSYAL